MSALPEFKITQTFDAPREKVWKAWTVRENYAQWFGPKGWTCKNIAFDCRPGGIVHGCLTPPQGNPMYGKFVYREVMPQEKLVWEHSFADKDANIVRHPYHPVWPLKMLATVTLKDAGSDKTELTLTWSPLDANAEESATFAKEIPNMNQGWGGTFEQLAGFLKSAA